MIDDWEGISDRVKQKLLGSNQITIEHWIKLSAKELNIIIFLYMFF